MVFAFKCVLLVYFYIFVSHYKYAFHFRRYMKKLSVFTAAFVIKYNDLHSFCNIVPRFLFFFINCIYAVPRQELFNENEFLV